MRLLLAYIERQMKALHRGENKSIHRRDDESIHRERQMKAYIGGGGQMKAYTEEKVKTYIGEKMKAYIDGR